MPDSDGVVDDAELIRRIQTGSRTEIGDAFEQLVRRDSSRLLIHLSRQGLTSDECRQAASETWRRVVGQINRFEYCGIPLFAWIRAIAERVAKEIRKKRLGLSLEELDEWGQSPTSESDPASEALANLTREQIRAAVREVLHEAPPDFQAVIECQFIHEFSTEEIMQLHDWSQSKVYTTKHRALAWLRSRLLERYGSSTIDGWLQPP